MTPYTYYCPIHGYFETLWPFGQAPSAVRCTDGALDGHVCAMHSDRVFNGNLGFTQGRAAFSNGIEGDGQTNREWAERTKREFKERTGREAEPVGSRWI